MPNVGHKFMKKPFVWGFLATGTGQSEDLNLATRVGGKAIIPYSTHPRWASSPDQNLAAILRGSATKHLNGVYEQPASGFLVVAWT